MTDPSARLAILLSGRGSNFTALAQACASGELPAEIVLVMSNVANAPGSVTARKMGLPTAVVENAGKSRERHEQEVRKVLAQAGVDWICLAGYMRLLSANFVGAYPERIVNIHPSLLPSFPGLHVHEQAIEYGVKVSGCTVHLVDDGLDSGPIVLQRVLEVGDRDTPELLASRVLLLEHEAYKHAMRRLIVESWRIQGRRVVFNGG